MIHSVGGKIRLINRNQTGDNFQLNKSFFKKKSMPINPNETISMSSCKNLNFCS